MRCPRCRSDQSSVVDSRADDQAIRRRRECAECKLRFTTYERVELALPLVLKKDCRREPFDRAKIRAGLIRACEKTAVGIDQIDQTVDKIEAQLSEMCLKEVASRHIGDLLMQHLRTLDKVAYVRFASVYREFSDLNQFVDTLESLKDQGHK